MPHLSPSEIDEGLQEWEGSRTDLSSQIAGMRRPHIINEKLKVKILVNGKDQIELIVKGSMLSNHSVLQLLEGIIGRANKGVTISRNMLRKSPHVIQAVWNSVCIGEDALVRINEGLDTLVVELH